MCTLLEMKKRIESLKVIELTGKSIRQTDDDLVGWQQEQMFQGKKKTGGVIKPFYRPVTKRIKKAKGQPYDRVTLKDTGAFYDAMIVDVGTDVYNISSEDNKAGDLEAKYSTAIWGLGGVYRTGYLEQNLQPALVKNIKNILKV